MTTLTIGNLAKKAGISTDAVRFYERSGLLDKPARTASNYRIYPAEDAVRLRFIKRAKDLGFSLAEIKEFLALRHDPGATKSDVKNKADHKIRDIRAKIDDLTKILAALERLTASCDGHGPLEECPIIEALEDVNGKERHHHG